ncbi:MAG: tetratricopeptide repeat protein, partial [Terriglobales bacterium]
LDPKKYSAALFIGDAYFGARDFAQAGVWYERAIQLEPNRETAYRYYSDMLTKQGDMVKARSLAIQAVIAEPYNPITWRGLTQWAIANRLQVKRIRIKIPGGVTRTGDKNITINIDPAQPKETSSVWLAYGLARATWDTDKFKQQFPQETAYRHSLAEEADALTTAATVWTEQSEGDKKPASKPPADSNLLALLKLHHANLIEPYVLLDAPDEGIMQDYAAYREKNRAKLEEYLSTFVVPAAPLK